MYSEQPLTYQLGQTMKLVYLKLMEKFNENHVDLSVEHFSMLHYINQNGRLTQQDMANHFLRDKSIILRQVNALIDLQYVTRRQDADDKRKKNLILTAKGARLLDFSKELAHEVSSELLEGVSEDELKHFEAVITKIQRNTGYKKCLSCCTH